MTVTPFGSWPTPFTAEVVLAAATSLDDVQVDGEHVVWGESRPHEGGRIALVRRAADGSGDPVELLGPDANVRTAVHEYGGRAWWCHDGALFYVDWSDQRLRRLDPGHDPVALTPEPAAPRGDRYADGDVSADGATIVCVRERHPDDPTAGAAAVRNEVVQLSASAPSEPSVLVSGPDFVAAPRLSPDGRWLAWLSWNHPSMPWDDVELRVRDLGTGEETVVAGGRGESVTEPRWQPDGSLLFLSDRTDWWNLYRAAPDVDISTVVRVDAEIGVPGWRFGTARYASLPDGRIVFGRRLRGLDVLAVRDPDGTVADLDLPFSRIDVVRALPSHSAVVVLAGSPTAEFGVHRIDLPVPTEDARVVALRAGRELGVPDGAVSVPEHVTFPSPDPDAPASAGEPMRVAHGFFYPPTSAEHVGPDGARPPLIVIIHGGPTSAAVPVLNPGVQYWTSRGFAVVDVDHGGSTGYGRAYREQLKGRWGVIDVADCRAAASWLAARGRVDEDRMAIRGGSAGGFTTLAALASADTPFAAGADLFGVADLAALARDTHKFESRYLDGLVGPWPQAEALYTARSPITHIAEFTRPLIVLQGADDPVVPPAQSELIVDALRSRGVPVAYLLFDGEQHGFRIAANLRRALEAELSFYAQVFGFALPAADRIEPVEVGNLGSAPGGVSRTGT